MDILFVIKLEIISVIISCIFNLIFCVRGMLKYKEIEGKYLYCMALILFTILIPIVNIIVSAYFMIFLFERIKGEKVYRKNEII